MNNNEAPLSYIKKAEIYFLHNGVSPDFVEPAEVAKIQKELDINPCEITFIRSGDTNDKTAITEEGEVLMEKFFSRFSITPDEAPPVIRSMAEDMAMRALSNGHSSSKNGFTNSTDLSSGVEFEV